MVKTEPVQKRKKYLETYSTMGRIGTSTSDLANLALILECFFKYRNDSQGGKKTLYEPSPFTNGNFGKLYLINKGNVYDSNMCFFLFLF